MSSSHPPGNAELQLGSNGESAQKGAKKSAKLELGAPSEGAPGVGAPHGWYSRGYLPHRDDLHLFQVITFRQADSLPQEQLRQLERELAGLAEVQRAVYRRKRLEAWLDAGMGSRALAHPQVAEVMQGRLAPPSRHPL